MAQNIVYDKRSKQRDKCEARAIVTIGTHSKSAFIDDFSLGGVSVVYHGDPIQTDAKVKISAEKLDIRSKAALVVWSKSIVGGLSHSGLKYVD